MSPAEVFALNHTMRSDTALCVAALRFATKLMRAEGARAPRPLTKQRQGHVDRSASGQLQRLLWEEVKRLTGSWEPVFSADSEVGYTFITNAITGMSKAMRIRCVTLLGPDDSYGIIVANNQPTTINCGPLVKDPPYRLRRAQLPAQQRKYVDAIGTINANPA